MRLRFPARLYFPATMLFAACVCGAELPVEPYTSRPTASEMAFVTEWKNFLLRRGNAHEGRYGADLPFSFKCGAEAAENGSASKRRTSSPASGRMTTPARMY